MLDWGSDEGFAELMHSDYMRDLGWPAFYSAAEFRARPLVNALASMFGRSQG